MFTLFSFWVDPMARGLGGASKYWNAQVDEGDRHLSHDFGSRVVPLFLLDLTE